MSINIKTDPLQSAILFDRPVLFTSQRIPREEVPEGWYYYELRGSVRNAKKPIALSDHAYVNLIGSVLSPVPLKRADTISRRVNGQFLLLGETMTLRDYCRNNSLEYPLRNQTFVIRPASPEEAGIFYALPPEPGRGAGRHRACPYGLWPQREGVLAYMALQRSRGAKHPCVQSGAPGGGG